MFCLLFLLTCEITGGGGYACFTHCQISSSWYMQSMPIEKTMTWFSYEQSEPQYHSQILSLVPKFLFKEAAQNDLDNPLGQGPKENHKTRKASLQQITNPGQRPGVERPGLCQAGDIKELFDPGHRTQCCDVEPGQSTKVCKVNQKGPQLILLHQTCAKHNASTSLPKLAPHPQELLVSVAPYSFSYLQGNRWPFLIH